MTETFSCELWLVLKCDLMGFCNLMYYKSDANFHRFIFLYPLSHEKCRRKLNHCRKLKESRNMKILWTVSFNIHYKVSYGAYIDYANRIDLACTKVSSYVCIRNLSSFLFEIVSQLASKDSWWDNFAQPNTLKSFIKHSKRNIYMYNSFPVVVLNR